MQFLYHLESGASKLRIEGESYRYLFKVRRLGVEEPIFLRHLEDDKLFVYRIVSLDKRKADLALIETRQLRIAPRRFLHLGWCIIDPKKIEKMLPTLNEIGVGKISFIRCARTQRNFDLDFERLKRILINSSQQCGRSTRMELERFSSLEEFLYHSPDAWLLDFSQHRLECDEARITSVVIGCEGGLVEKERVLFPDERIVGFGTDLILRSESAACAVAARLLL